MPAPDSGVASRPHSHNSPPSPFTIATIKRLATALSLHRLRKTTTAATKTDESRPTITTTTTTKLSSLSAITNVKSALARSRRRKSRGSVFTSVTPSPSPIQTLRAAAVSTAAAIGRHPAHPKSPDEYIVSGNVAVFAAAIPAKFYRLPGEGVKELVLLKADVLLQDLVRPLKGKRFGGVKLAGVRLARQTEAEGEEAGVWITASIDFVGPLREAGQLIEGLFEIQKAALDVKGFVGSVPDWKAPLEPGRFGLKGVMAGEYKEGRKIAFTKVAVELKVEREEEGGYSTAVEFSGDVVMTLPGGVVKMGWTMMEETPGTWTLRVEDKEIGDVVGFKGLNLVDLEFVANFPVNKDILDLNFEVQAGLNFGNIALLLKGGYGQDFYLETNVPHCTMDDIRELYTLTTGRELEPFHHSIKFDDITFRVDPNGLQFSGEVTVDGHRSVGATIAIKRDGIAITGSVLDIQLGAITVEKGQLDIFIGRPAGNETSRQSGFAITGNVSFHHLELEVAVYTTFTEGEGVQWTVYGEIEGTEMQLHRLAPDVKDSWLDLELTQVAFIASSCDSPKGCYNVFDYPIRKGVQFCATISSCLKPLDHITNKQINGLVLRAAWSPDRGFSFGVVLPTPVGIHLTKSITSGPVEVEIIVSKMPQLQLTASVNYAAPRQSQPLVFTLGLRADLDSAEGFGQMTNYWYGPFGIEGVKIGPNVALEVGIIYAVLVATGTPSKLGFSAGLAIGDVEAQVRAVISEDPADELIYASLNQLSIQDLAKFASQISGEEIPLPPEDLLCFRNVLLYLSTGTSVGTTYYPAGASFRGQMDLFGQTTKHECTVGATTKIATEFEGLQLGPLTVGGAVGGKSCSAVVELGVDKQHILIDGAVILFDFEASIHGVFDILPTPNMEFELRLAYAEALEITLGAKIVGVPSFSNLSDADFEVYAILEQDIIGYLVRQIRYCIEALSKLLDGGIDAAYEFIDDAQDAIEDSIAAAVDTFEEARIAWEEKQIAVKNALQEVQDDFESSIKSLQDDLFGTRKEVEEAISNAQKELEQAKVQTVTAVSSATHEVRRTKMEHEKGIASQLYAIREVKEKTKSAFGAVEMKVRETEEKVKRTQSYYDSCDVAYQSALEQAHFYSPINVHLTAHRLKHVRNDALAELTTLKSLLAHAKASAESAAYTQLKSAKEAKKQQLRTARSLHDKKVAEAEADLAAHKQASQAVVQLWETRTGEAEARAKEVEAKERQLDDFRQQRSPIIEKFQHKAETLQETEEFTRMKGAQEQRRKAGLKRLDKEAARKVVDGIVDRIDRGRSVEEVVLDVERVELRGSLRELVVHGRPLKATMMVVLMGARREVVVDWGLGDVVGLVQGVVEAAWEVLGSEE